MPVMAYHEELKNRPRRWRHHCRDSHPSIHMIARDLHRALRRLRREPAFTTPAVVALGIGIGAVSAVFALVYTILLSPLPYPRAEQLVAVSNVAPGIGLTGGGISEGVYMHYRKHNQVFEEIGAYFDRTLAITDGG